MERNAKTRCAKQMSWSVHLFASWDPPGRQSGSVVTVARTSFSPHLRCILILLHSVVKKNPISIYIYTIYIWYTNLFWNGSRRHSLSAWLRTIKCIKCWFRGGSGQGHICRQIARRMPERSTKFAAHYLNATNTDNSGLCSYAPSSNLTPLIAPPTSLINSHHMICVFWEVFVLTTWYCIANIAIQIHAFMKNQSEGSKGFLVQSWRKFNRWRLLGHSCYTCW